MNKGAIIFAILKEKGAILCCFLSAYFAMVSFIVWLVLFFKEVHIDTEKAFGKYRL